MAIDVEQYKALIFSIPEAIKNSFIAPAAPLSRVETRYITSNVADDEEWIGNLRDDAGVVDIWLITLAATRILPPEERGMSGGGGNKVFDKPLSILVDYFADYRQGTDTDNTERDFLEKTLAFEYYLETAIRDCVLPNVYIESAEIRYSIKRFSSSAAHRMMVVLNLRITDIQTNNGG